VKEEPVKTVVEPKAEVVEPKKEVVEIHRFPPAKIPENNKADVIISLGVNPNEFFVQLDSEADQLDQLTPRLQTYCAQAAKISKDHIYLGVACAAKYSMAILSR